MPNECNNHISIVCHENPDQLQQLYDNELKKDNVVHKSEQGILMNYTTSWNPDFEWLDSLVEKYPLCWIKNEWDEEGGSAGVYVNGTLNGVKQERLSVNWNDICIEGRFQYFGKQVSKDQIMYYCKKENKDNSDDSD